MSPNTCKEKSKHVQSYLYWKKYHQAFNTANLSDKDLAMNLNENLESNKTIQPYMGITHFLLSYIYGNLPSPFFQCNFLGHFEFIIIKTTLNVFQSITLNSDFG